jgi:UDP-N-acetylglucosamine 2-epimerase (non-hydrolysing)
MKIMTILGTRPEIIRLSAIIPLLDTHADHVLVHTGQNYDDRLSGLFFRELGIRGPDHYMGVRAITFGEQVGQILSKAESLFLGHRPDRLLVLGDTNSGLTAVIARRLGIPVFHMEAGNRCYDDRVPEEVNRRVIDHSSSVLLPYTNRSRENLLHEGIHGSRIFVTGNPIRQVLNRYADAIAGSGVLGQLGVTDGKHILVTMHRAENVDRGDKLKDLVEALRRLTMIYGFPVICSFHPRTQSKVETFGVDISGDLLRFVEPLGFFDFVRLEQTAFCVLSDSGTVQEETSIFRRPNVTIREVTERPETVDCGSNFLAGTDPNEIVRAVDFVTSRATNWMPPAEYEATAVAETVCRIVLGFRPSDAAEVEWKSGARIESSEWSSIQN